jgi:hypothetical protein
LLLRAPEPVDQQAVLAVAALLAGPRREALTAGPGRAARAEPSAGALERSHHHAAPRHHASRLGVVLLAAILLIVISTLVIAALAGG